VYFGLLVGSLWLAYQLRFDFFVAGYQSDKPYLESIPRVILWVVSVKLFVLVVFRQFSGVLSYFGTPDLYRLARAVFVASAVVGIARVQSSSFSVPPRGVILIDFLLTFGALAFFRIGCRVIREILAKPDGEEFLGEATRTMIIGAEDEGADLAKEFLNKRGLGRRPVAFLDDDRSKLGSTIHNVPVVGSQEDLEDTIGRFRVDECIIAMPRASVKNISKLIKELRRLHIKVLTIPSLNQLTTGRVRVSQVRSVEIQDLLGREAISLNREGISDVVDNKVVMVTGAGGSIGSELCRQLVGFNPSQILLVEQSEFLLFQIEQELVEKGYGGTIFPLVANILDEPRMREIHQRFAPEIVFHAAAVKHVPMMERQPAEAVKVNFFGTALLAKIALEFGVSRFVLISTDKAINPTSVMGATKRLAEMYIQALSKTSGAGKTGFMAVRFGNVLGSSGSVIPTFKRQISVGGPVKVTHPDVSRYFMTIPEAVGLVLQCAVHGEGGEIFVLDMGDSIKIVDLARQMIELSGLRPDEDIDIEFVGLRPGEKLFEELQHEGENLVETGHSKIMRFVGQPGSPNQLEEVLENWKGEVQMMSRSEIRKRLKDLVPEYKAHVV